ncbi:hypothetical protein JCM8097_004711 [Rhodosporidiobolus ruineniae]
MPRSPSPARSMSRSRSRSRSPPNSDTIRVGKLTKNVTAIHLEEIFDVYGKIIDIDLPIIKRLGTHKGTAWISFASPSAAAKAASYMDGGQIDGSYITVDLEPPSPRGGAAGAPAGGYGRRSVSPPRGGGRAPLPRGRSRSPPRRGRSASRSRSRTRSASPMRRSRSPVRKVRRSPSRGRSASYSPRRSPQATRGGAGGGRKRYDDRPRGRSPTRSPSPYDRDRARDSRR